MTALLVACLVVAAVAAMAWPGNRRPIRRLAGLAERSGGPVPSAGVLSQLHPGAPRPPAAGSGAGAGRPSRLRFDRQRLVALLAGLSTALLIGGWLGGLAGAVVAVGADRGLRRLEPAEVRARRAAEAAGLPLAADLLSVALRGGAPTDRATAAVAEALPGPLGDRLAQTSRLLALGAGVEQAWSPLAQVPGAGRLVRAAVRSAEHGSALADTFARLADDLRADRTIAAETAARRAGVLIVLPLGGCFLPAFMLAGLVPVIVAVLGDVL